MIAGRAGSVTFHSWTNPSEEPTASTSPTGLKTTDVTSAPLSSASGCEIRSPFSSGFTNVPSSARSSDAPHDGAHSSRLYDRRENFAPRR
jgi:hypothetical protein